MYYGYWGSVVMRTRCPYCSGVVYSMGTDCCDYCQVGWWRDSHWTLRRPVDKKNPNQNWIEVPEGLLLVVRREEML